MKRTTLHIVGGDSRSRAEQARIAFALGHHAEVYSEFEELLDRPPSEGIIIAADNDEVAMIGSLIRKFGEHGIWLPVVVASDEPRIDRAVAAIKAGAIDYLTLPLEMGSFVRRLAGIIAESREYAERRRREVNARHSIGMLSRREREVLELLSAGRSNREIGSWLDISPRTVEIHRGNMMTKLAAGHIADAIRLWLDAQFELPTVLPANANDDVKLDQAVVAGRIRSKRTTARTLREARRQRQ
ncbi:response regulator transcription factor [Altererythrobacter sp. Root672]|uniref:response regulator transcription factor n=1 Tax=Altererythrobacter sp. Root672 TaxID=1736584 RepID=UPI0009EB54CE|nr:LuxR C-terminal-related transcriptional regulator [Altererythrobacter sp. Root672]